MRRESLQRASLKRKDTGETEKPFPAAGLGLRVGPGVVLGGRQALAWLLGEGTAPEMGGRWSLAQGEGPPGLRLTSLAFGTGGLVKGPPAVLGATEAGDLDVLDRELIVVCDLLVDIDVLLRVDDNLLL